MIIIRSPLRISIGGGGTDIPSYYEKRGSFFISAAIDKYVYVTLTRPFEKGIYLKYSKIDKDVVNIKIDKRFFFGFKNEKVKVENA